jgi:hypothetical protein
MTGLPLTRLSMAQLLRHLLEQLAGYASIQPAPSYTEVGSAEKYSLTVLVLPLIRFHC